MTSIKSLKDKQNLRKEQEKAIIELSNSFEEANNFLELNLGLVSLHSKIKYLQENFNIEFIGHNIENTFDDYRILLTSIIDAKWHK